MTVDPAFSFQPRCHAPDKTAFFMCATGEHISFRQLEARANQGAHLLRRARIKQGDHIAILLENRREFLEICFAADRAGIYYTTISAHLAKREIAYIVNDCGAKILITSCRFLEMVASLKPELDHIETCYLAGEEKAPGFINWAEEMTDLPTTPIADEAQGLDMLYSSGTTGQPKGIKWPLTASPPGGRTMLLELLTSLFGYDAKTRYLCPAPLYHAAPLRHTMTTIRMGGSAYIMDRFDAEKALELIDTYNITHSQWVPTMFVRFLKLPKAVRNRFDGSSMEMVVHAAATCPIEIKRQMIDWWGEIIHEYYAGTENNGFTAITCKEWLEHPGSVGRAKLGKIHICDDDGHEVPTGAQGEVYFENGHQFEYHKDPEKTRASRNHAGWTTLGDIGRVDEEGYLYLTDRKSFMIISGGVNIYPQEIENVLLTHQDVQDVAVIGVPSEDFGEDVKALVQLVEGCDPSLEQADRLINFCRTHLSSLKCPKTLEFRETLPRSATGKLYKQQLKDEFWSENISQKESISNI